MSNTKSEKKVTASSSPPSAPTPLPPAASSNADEAPLSDQDPTALGIGTCLGMAFGSAVSGGVMGKGGGAGGGREGGSDQVKVAREGGNEEEGMTEVFREG